jgi:hypothetical protein
MITNTPIIGIAGKAGSGKDTVGNFIAQFYNGVTIGQADPMKKFVKDVFRFDEETLWGASKLRESLVDVSIESSRRRFHAHSSKFIASLVNEDRASAAYSKLSNWFNINLLAIEGSGNLTTPRSILQSLGTSWGRGINRELWNEYAIKVAKTLLGGGYTYTRAGGLVETAGAKVDYVVITDIRFMNECLNLRYLGGPVFRITRDVADDVAATHVSELEMNEIPNHFFSSRIDNNQNGKHALFSDISDTMIEVFGDRRGIANEDKWSV